MALSSLPLPGGTQTKTVDLSVFVRHHSGQNTVFVIALPFFANAHVIFVENSCMSWPFS